MSTGLIHSVESMGVHDGPGIRYVVFTQGCPLRCQYCHNPDTWMRKAGKRVEAGELLLRVLKCKPYMDSSGGGVTISGGEPTLQPGFVRELLKACKEQGIHTALDTSGYVTPEVFSSILPYIDLVLLDIKHIKEEKHRDLTGVSNERTLELISLLEKEKQPYWIRHVIVPGITDNRDDLNQLASYLSNLNGLERVELLPYHRLGVYKWQELGYEYRLEGIEPPSRGQMQEIKGLFIKKGVSASIAVHG
ncbi:pyruvate formate-lyase-activating protein [Halothermothrix orenii]|uniref:Pyruvate formate-lyase-activating enzyme n=1 Tax=Halothermothrix orenii (strain H 168 / OCM 544 / DSM 9562) TaxID=373903 RepID=B8D1A9_HALOH|nr:pyruvate formate-lyase-activating protein [Halothermothrix orenii]ACL71061.1 pyruvate formate-lyase activating enzyme [Halothermothrix orenii H 168]